MLAKLKAAARRIAEVLGLVAEAVVADDQGEGRPVKGTQPAHPAADERSLVAQVQADGTILAPTAIAKAARALAAARTPAEKRRAKDAVKLAQIANTKPEPEKIVSRKKAVTAKVRPHDPAPPKTKAKAKRKR
jgi:hypothetical protein